MHNNRKGGEKDPEDRLSTHCKKNW